MPLQKRVLLFACDKCKVVLKKIPTMVLLMEKVKQQLANMRNMDQPTFPKQISKYSEVVKKNTEKVVVIKPKDKKQDSSVTQKAIE
ncbi:unnamed protein product [Acanthoscelides obtectus]|uniref:Uncharacterized protein n=1 Tax=Acanthoscelides obtectus TaxID=200917 RepID=A0A9P0KFJ1_ACAOB|nr:unnamed protein product [Acanthoscelides obtectus]CAK1681678.1 hypothetical protein AOBTE_LOCUS33206 [Acanthoscelides obtectus]